MSSYLTFKLVPKKMRERYKGAKSYEEKITEGIPLTIASYSRNSPIYQALYDTGRIVYAWGKEDGEEKYTEITKEIFDEALGDMDEEIKSTEERLETDYKILKACYNEDVHNDILSFEKYLAEQKRDREDLEQLKFFLLNAIKYTDFEKILANVD